MTYTNSSKRCNNHTTLKNTSNALGGYELHNRTTPGMSRVSDSVSYKNVFGPDPTEPDIRLQIRRLGGPLPDMTNACNSSSIQPFFYPHNPTDLFKNIDYVSKKNMHSYVVPQEVLYYSTWGVKHKTTRNKVLGDTHNDKTFFNNTSGERFHNNRQALPLYTKQHRISSYDQSLDQFSC